jgi:hypothetical protein
MTADTIADDSQRVGATRFERAAMVYARVALGTAFLSAVAGRFGIWDRSVDWAHFERFMRRTAEVNAFMPAVTIPFLAWALLLAMFAMAMAVSTGIKPPLDYSVFSASAGALLLALRARRT